MLIIGALIQARRKVHEIHKTSVCDQTLFAQLQHRSWLIYRNHTT